MYLEYYNTLLHMHAHTHDITHVCTCTCMYVHVHYMHRHNSKQKLDSPTFLWASPGDSPPTLEPANPGPSEDCEPPLRCSIRGLGIGFRLGTGLASFLFVGCFSLSLLSLSLSSAWRRAFSSSSFFWSWRSASKKVRRVNCNTIIQWSTFMQNPQRNITFVKTDTYS